MGCGDKGGKSEFITQKLLLKRGKIRGANLEGELCKIREVIGSILIYMGRQERGKHQRFRGLEEPVEVTEVASSRLSVFKYECYKTVRLGLPKGIITPHYPPHSCIELSSITHQNVVRVLWKVGLKFPRSPL